VLVRGACCYLVVLTVMMLLENRLVYHPYSAAELWQAPTGLQVEDVTLKGSGDQSIHAWWCPTDNWTPQQGALIYCQGNGGNLSMRVEALKQWLHQGHTSILIFDYPGYGRSEGSPSEAGCYAAAQAAYGWLIETKHVPEERVLIYGASLGGGVATDLASRNPHRALILLMTFTSLPDAAGWHYPWLPTHWLMRNRFDSISKIGRCSGPIFIAHGTADRVVGFHLGERLYAAAPEPKRFMSIPGGGHDEMLPEGFLANLQSFLDAEERSKKEGTSKPVALDESTPGVVQ
jgi:fermentation-respiration switch protein FrsA (DUF1100 family)